MFPALHRHAKRAAGNLGREAISRKQAHFPQDAGGGAAARAAGQGEVLHPPLEGEHLGLSGTGQAAIVHIGPLGEGRVKAQSPHLLPQSILLVEKVRPLPQPDSVGHTGSPQLHIGNVFLAMQVQNRRQVQGHPVLVLIHPPALDQARSGFKDHRVSGNALIVGKPADAPGAVAAHPPGSHRHCRRSF